MRVDKTSEDYKREVTTKVRMGRERLQENKDYYQNVSTKVGIGRERCQGK